MSLVGYFTHAEGRQLFEDCTDPTLKHKLWRLLSTDLLADESEPRTVVLRDEGDGVHLSAVTFDNALAADRAWDASRGYLDPGVLPPPKRSRTRA